MNNKPKYQRALDWVNRQRATRDLEPITEWPENTRRIKPRCKTCPIAAALGSGWWVGVTTAESPEHVFLDLPKYVRVAIKGFDADSAPSA